MSEAIRITLIEDDEAIRETITAILAFAGYEVTAYANGQEALEGLNKADAAPEMILCDLMMPVMDGWQFLDAQERQREIHKVPVVVISADPSPLALEHEAVREVVNKPFDLDALLVLVRKYCRRSEVA